MGVMFAVGAGGALGALLRHMLSGAIQGWSGGVFPWGVLAVNVSGCLVMGIIAQAIVQGWQVSPEVRMFLMTGVLGGFTTFSAFALDAAVLAQRGDAGAALMYVLASVAGSIMSLFLGLFLVRALAS